MNTRYTGLAQEEARELLKKFGPNEIRDPHSFSWLSVLVHQVENNFVIYLLIAAAAISFFVGKQITAYTILAVVFMVIIVGFIQEYKAERAISSLKKMIMPISIVRRGSKDMDVPSVTLVPGDIVVLGNGERIPADCAVLEDKDLRVDESVLTGESKDIRKKAVDAGNLTDDNLIFMGTFVVNGRCIGKVLHTGMNTHFGKIAGMISTAKKELPLQRKVNRISKYLVIIAITVSLLTGILMFFRAETINMEVVSGIMLLVIALFVSALPEGFPVVLIATLASGAARMAKQNVIVNRMSIIETVGETTVICADKTGTLTCAEMTIRKIQTPSKLIEVTGSGFEGKGDFLFEGKPASREFKEKELEMLFKTAVLCNDSKIERTGEDLEYKVRGSPTEGALLVMASKAEVFQDNLDSIRIEEIPFSSDRKMMSILSKEEDRYICYAKGAPEILIEKCSYFLKDGKVSKLTAKEKDDLLSRNRQMNRDVLRTLALSYKMLDKEDKNYKERDFIFLGLVAMEDPPRDEVKETIKTCFSAGIKVKMITGDNKETALSISREIGLTGKVLEGKELDELTDDELAAVVGETVIFARVRPEHKLRIVKALKKNNEVVTMTGDGVNDSPALKEAHIGVAMGKNGTDVSMSIADLTLKDDNFVSIVAGIKEGRTIFNNIRKFATYQISCNIAELAILFFGVLLAPLFGWVAPLLLALQIIFMNLVTDNLPALTLSFNPSSKDVMRENPRIKKEILNRQLMIIILLNGGLMALLTLFAYFASFNIIGQDTETARTTALVALILLEIASAFNFRSFRYKVLNRSLFVNKYLVYASAFSIFATLIILYTSANKVFGTVPLGISGWLISIEVGLLIIVIYDLLKDYRAKRPSLFPDVH
jgi:Ca2+-transporting ATPase